MKANSFLQPFGIAKRLATKKVVRQFARKFDLVYFGFVDQREAEYELVRGLTVSADHVDTNYSVGNFQGFDVTLVERHDRLSFPNKPSREYRWMILQVDLQIDNLPHIFLDANHHDETFYANLFVKFSQFERANQLFAELHDPLFAQRFKVYAEPHDFSTLSHIMTPEVTSMLAYHFPHFDFEIFEDRLLVLASNTVVTMGTLQDMLRVGMWLAHRLNQDRAESESE